MSRPRDPWGDEGRQSPAKRSRYGEPAADEPVVQEAPPRRLRDVESDAFGIIMQFSTMKDMTRYGVTSKTSQKRLGTFSVSQLHTEGAAVSKESRELWRNMGAVLEMDVADGVKDFRPTKPVAVLHVTNRRRLPAEVTEAAIADILRELSAVSAGSLRSARFDTTYNTLENILALQRFRGVESLWLHNPLFPDYVSRNGNVSTLFTRLYVCKGLREFRVTHDYEVDESERGMLDGQIDPAFVEKLEVLDLSEMVTMTRAQMVAVAGAPNLRELRLADDGRFAFPLTCTVETLGLYRAAHDTISTLQHMPRLHSLFLDRSLSDNTPRVYRTLPPLRQFKLIADPLLADVVLGILRKKSAKTLRVLSLQERYPEEIEAADQDIVRALAPFTELEELRVDMSIPSHATPQIEDLADSLTKLRSLKIMNIPPPYGRGRGDFPQWAAIVRLLEKLPGLEDFAINNPQGTDAPGLDKIANLKTLRIPYVNSKEEPYQDQQYVFRRIARMPNLRRLDLSADTNVEWTLDDSHAISRSKSITHIEMANRTPEFRDLKMMLESMEQLQTLRTTVAFNGKHPVLKSFGPIPSYPRTWKEPGEF